MRNLVQRVNIANAVGFLVMLFGGLAVIVGGFFVIGGSFVLGLFSIIGGIAVLGSSLAFFSNPLLRIVHSS